MKDYKVKIYRHTITIKDIKANSEKQAEQEALAKLALHGWAFVNAESIVTEVERVYETRWDCCICPPKVIRRAA